MSIKLKYIERYNWAKIMISMEDFSQWLNMNTKLSESSVYKYTRAVATVSREMFEQNVISKDIVYMNLFELDIAIKEIFSSEFFLQKDKKGNKMYSNSLKHFRCFLNSLCSQIDDYAFPADELKTISVTERETIVKSRIGQGLFREKLLKKYNGKCMITGISIEKCLVASHIKPWAVCTNNERLSDENGLLLSATFDRLFDSGYISFNNNGVIIVSNLIDDANKEILNINKIKIDIPDSANLKSNLEYHRDIIFLK